MAAGSPAAKTGSAVGAARPGSAVADHELGLVRQAMAYRVKYRVAGGKRQMYLSLLGVHPLNRAGVYPSPETVQNLGLKLLQTGLKLTRRDAQVKRAAEITSKREAGRDRFKERSKHNEDAEPGCAAWLPKACSLSLCFALSPSFCQ